jgi:hypothetical protein
MDFTQKCRREGCLYKKHSDITNNNGKYCCNCCTFSKKQHGPLCEKKFIIDKLIYCDASEGFNDILIQLGKVTEYAIKYNYSIVLINRLYGASKYSDLFDFTDYPCKIFIDDDAKTVLEYVRYLGFKEHVENSCHRIFLSKQFPHELIIVRRHWITWQDAIDEQSSSTYEIKKPLSESVRCWGMLDPTNKYANKSLGPIYFFTYVKLNAYFKQFIINKLASLPKDYIGIHIRYTDRGEKNKIDFTDMEQYILEQSDKPILLATDNNVLLNKMCKKYSNIISTGSLDNIKTKKYSSLHKTFNNETHILWGAIVDLIILANASHLKTTLEYGCKSGYSRLIVGLHKNKHILAALLS